MAIEEARETGVRERGDGERGGFPLPLGEGQGEGRAGEGARTALTPTLSQGERKTVGEGERESSLTPTLSQGERETLGVGERELSERAGDSAPNAEHPALDTSPIVPRASHSALRPPHFALRTPPIALSTPHPALGTSHSAPKRLWLAACVLWRVAFGPFLSTVLALGVLLASVLYLFRNALVDGLIYYRSDTVTYYFPIADRLIDALREGRLLLWTRYIFGGFPLFADGEAGMLYPPNLIAYLFLSEQESIVWLRIARYSLAATFTFAYLRALRLNGFAAVVGALSFTFGGFMIAQMHHTNVVNTAIWLPLTLYMVEMAVRSVRRWRWLYASAAGASVGIQALGIHIQPLLMSGFFLAVYIPFRVLLCPIAWPRRRGDSRKTLPHSSRPAARLPMSPGTKAAAPRRALAALRRGISTLATRGRARLVVASRALLAATRRRVAALARTGWAGLGKWIRLAVAWLVDAVRSAWEDFTGISLLEPEARDAISHVQGKGDVWITKNAKEAAKRTKGLLAGMSPVAVRARWVATSVYAAARWIGHPVARAFALFASLIAAFAVQTARLAAGVCHRLILAGLILAMVPAIAFGLAAAQVIPLVELGLFSFRGSGVSYQFATSYSMPVQNLVNLVFPYFFRYTNRFYWSLWSEWETTLYAGIAPLVLASIAVLFVRNRLVLLFAALGVVSTLLAFGNYSPYPLYEQFWHLPGFSSLRVPGRFTMLITLCISVLAGYGADWLCRTLRPLPAVEIPGLASLRRQPVGFVRACWRWLSRTVAVNGFAVYLLGLLVAMATVVWWLASFRMWLEKEPWAVKRFIEEAYLSLPNGRGWLTSDMVLSFLNYALDPTQDRTTTSLAVMLATFLLLLAWFALRRLWRVWAALLVVLVAFDMLTFATDFHPTVHINQLSNPNSATRWLAAQNVSGMDRVYSAADVRKTEANKLLPFKVAEVTGYSSLQTTRHLDYMNRIADNEKSLLDLYNVRFVVFPKRFPALPSFEYTAFHPTRPLADGPRTSRGSHVTLYVNPPVKADEVSIISSLRSAPDILQDAEVADIVVVDTRGERVTLKVRAGRETAEWALDRPDVVPNAGHRAARVADRIWTTDPDGRRYQASLYYGNLKLDRTRTVAKVEFHYTHPKGKIRLFGMMLWENPGTAHQVLGRDKFIPRYEDDEVLILENPSRFPRAFLVPTARIVRQSEVLDLMVSGDFDPEKVVLLESRDRAARAATPDAAGGELGVEGWLSRLQSVVRDISGHDIADLRLEEWLRALRGVVTGGPGRGLADSRVEEWLRGNPDTPPGRVDVIEYRSTSAVFRTVSDRNAMLFLSDSFYPGWKVMVDGHEERIYRANYLFRAVPVPAGEHEVRFVFEPETFALGTDISVFTASALLSFWVLMLVVVPTLRGTWRLATWAWRKLKVRRQKPESRF